MPKEIERKFLIKDLSLVPKGEEETVAQGYLPTENGITIRIRLVDNDSFITLKGHAEGISRDEFEYPIPRDHAEEILQKYCGSVVRKIRRKVQVGNHLWEVDVFQGDNYGLVFAEIELKSINEKFEKPSWVSKDVTAIHRYHNAHLAKYPFKEWSKSERKGE